MELELDLEDLLNKRRIESDRIEFKAGWNPDDIYRSICAFANDYNNDGGGYILVGVEEKNGVAVRSVKGLDEESLDRIQLTEDGRADDIVKAAQDEVYQKQLLEEYGLADK